MGISLLFFSGFGGSCDGGGIGCLVPGGVSPDDLFVDGSGGTTQNKTTSIIVPS